MSRIRSLGTLGAALLVNAIVALLLIPSARAQDNFKTLHAFKSTDGASSEAGLIFDQAGNLYGTTLEGGNVTSHCDNYGCGVVFRLTPSLDGSWTESVLYRFCSLSNCSDGLLPNAGLVFDQAGNLYGTTVGGGNLSYCLGGGCGVVFKLTPNADGSWTESVLHTFGYGTDGTIPLAGLVFDRAGNLYGTTASGGSRCQSGCGTVFKLTPNSDGRWAESVLYSFADRKDGGFPYAGLIFDQAGNLYGTTIRGGAHNSGTVFRLTPSLDGSRTESVLHAFNGNDGLFPMSGVILDQAGNLYGTTWAGGGYEDGVVFQLTPDPNGSWKETVLHRFRRSKDGGLPAAGLIFDQLGNLYGTTQYGGSHCDCGVVFKLTPNSNSGWKETVLHAFFGHPGTEPLGNLIFDAAGNLYGTTAGSSTFGSVFEITR